jgi:hypothetical protein
LTEFVRFAGNADQGESVRHVTLRGLTFHHADWVLDPKGNSSTQAAVEVPAAITADGALHCAVEGCEVAHIGTYGIWFRRGCKDCRKGAACDKCNKAADCCCSKKGKATKK